jgi:hypothetical protein
VLPVIRIWTDPARHAGNERLNQGAVVFYRRVSLQLVQALSGGDYYGLLLNMQVFSLRNAHTY